PPPGCEARAKRRRLRFANWLRAASARSPRGRVLVRWRPIGPRRGEDRWRDHRRTPRLAKETFLRFCGGRWPPLSSAASVERERIAAIALEPGYSVRWDLLRANRW